MAWGIPSGDAGPTPRRICARFTPDTGGSIEAAGLTLLGGLVYAAEVLA